MHWEYFSHADYPTYFMRGDAGRGGMAEMAPAGPVDDMDNAKQSTAGESDQTVTSPTRTNFPESWIWTDVQLGYDAERNDLRAYSLIL